MDDPSKSQIQQQEPLDLYLGRKIFESARSWRSSYFFVKIFIVYSFLLLIPRFFTFISILSNSSPSELDPLGILVLCFFDFIYIVLLGVFVLLRNIPFGGAHLSFRISIALNFGLSLISWILFFRLLSHFSFSKVIELYIISLIFSASVLIQLIISLMVKRLEESPVFKLSFIIPLLVAFGLILMLFFDSLILRSF